MDHQWHLRPVQGNICPTCSISHFPFCPPPPSLDQNPRFQFENDHSLHRPGFDPYRGSAGPNHPSDGFGDTRYWHRNPNLGRDSFGYAMYNGVHRDSYAPMSHHYVSNGFVSGGDRNNKRMRVDEMGSGAGTSEFLVNSSRVVSEEDERRLKLIREHGGASSDPLEGGVNSILGTNIGLNREIGVSERSFSHAGFGDHGKFDDLRGDRGEIASKPPCNMEMKNFRDPGFGSGDRRGSFLPSENDFNPHNLREEHGLSSGQQHMHNNRNGLNGLPNVPNNVEQAHQGHDAVVRHGADLGNSYYPTFPKGDLVQQPHMGQHGPYPIPEVPNENYHTHSIQQLQPEDSISAKETQFSHHTTWHRSSTLYHGQRSSILTENRAPNNQLPQPYSTQHPVQMKHDFHLSGHLSDTRESFDVKVLLHKSNQVKVGHEHLIGAAQYGPPNLNKQGGYLSMPGGGNIVSENLGQMQSSRVFSVQPPLPASPPPPLPVEPLGHPLSELKASYSPSKTSSLLFPIPASSSSAMVPSSYPPVSEARTLAQPYFHNKQHLPVSTGFVSEISSKQYLGERQLFPSKHFSSDKPKVIDASQLFKQPHRATRPDHVVIILRGLPGSGKSYLAKMLRDIEVENGGDAPRIHSMDDYFMTEVEKVEESEMSKSSSSVRGKKPIMKKVMEYCYEPEMEEAYRSSMLKAFKKTLEEGVFTFVIVDDRNLRVADFAQFWAVAKRSGYEVYILEATYRDPAGCAARNVHGFTQDDIQKMAGQWEEAPSLYLQLDIKLLFHGDDLKESGIQEVDMDMEDGDFDEGFSESQESKPEKIVVSSTGDHTTDALGSSKDEKRWDAGGDYPMERVKELGRSKWSDDLDEGDAERAEGAKGNLNALSGLIQAYGKEGKSVHWGDQVGKTGFSIGAAKKANVLSLVIGPGAGYNLRSNPLPEEENPTLTPNTGKAKRHSIFEEQLRAEHESFKAIFDRRRQRIGLDVEEE